MAFEAYLLAGCPPVRQMIARIACAVNTCELRGEAAYPVTAPSDADDTSLAYFASAPVV